MNVLRLYFSASPSGDIYIARQSDRKNPIHNPIHLSQLQNSRFAGIQKTESRIQNEILTQIQFVFQLF